MDFVLAFAYLGILGHKTIINSPKFKVQSPVPDGAGQSSKWGWPRRDN